MWVTWWWMKILFIFISYLVQECWVRSVYVFIFQTALWLQVFPSRVSALPCSIRPVMGQATQFPHIPDPFNQPATQAQASFISLRDKRPFWQHLKWRDLPPLFFVSNHCRATWIYTTLAPHLSFSESVVSCSSLLCAHHLSPIVCVFTAAD